MPRQLARRPIPRRLWLQPRGRWSAHPPALPTGELIWLPSAVIGVSPLSASASRAWHLVTGEYPPAPGGVADYPEAVAAALAKPGAGVHVWAPGDAERSVAEPDGVMVHRAAGQFEPADLVRL